MTRAPLHRIFLISPVRTAGERAALLTKPEASSPLARALQTSDGAELGEVFTFLSSLYFRGKLTYGRRFGAPPNALNGVYVITPGLGLRPPELRISADDLSAFGYVLVDAANPRFTEPLLHDAQALAERAGTSCEFVLLGSIATAKYVDPLLHVFGERLVFPSEFVGRGDMSRGGLLLRCARAGVELDYEPIATATRQGSRARRLEHLMLPSAPPRKRDEPSQT